MGFLDAVIKEIKEEYKTHMSIETILDWQEQGKSVERIKFMVAVLKQRRDRVNANHPTVRRILEGAKEIRINGIDEEVSRLLEE